MAKMSQEELREIQSKWTGPFVKPDIDTLLGHIRKLEAENARWKAAIEGLTPLGSEYVDDPEACAAAIRRRTQWPKQIIEARARVAELEAENSKLNCELVRWENSTTTKAEVERALADYFGDEWRGNQNLYDAVIDTVEGAQASLTARAAELETENREARDVIATADDRRLGEIAATRAALLDRIRAKRDEYHAHAAPHGPDGYNYSMAVAEGLTALIADLEVDHE